MSLRQLGRRAATSAAANRGMQAPLSVLERLPAARAGVLTVLTYHRVAPLDERPDLLPTMISAEPAAFAAQMRYVARHHRPVTLAEVMAAKREDRPLAPRSVLVTFDDGYDDVPRHAWPVLRELGIPMALFVATGYPDRAAVFWWDRLYDALRTTTRRTLPPEPVGALPVDEPAARITAFRALRDEVKRRPHDDAMQLVDRLCTELEAPESRPAVLGWDELRELASEGVELAPHGVSHALLTRVPTAHAVEELVTSRETLHAETGVTCNALAYPSGAWSRPVADGAAAAGFEVGFTTTRGVNRTSASDWMALRRINVGGSTTVPLLRAQLLPSLTRLGRWTRPPHPTG